MLRAVSILIAVVAAQANAQPGQPGERASPAVDVHVDPDAMREARGEALSVSGQAIAHYLEAQRLEQDGDWHAAAAELEQAVGYDDRSPDLRVALAEVLALSGQLQRAEAEARRGVELSRGAGPSASRAHVLLAHLAAAGRDKERAVLELRQAVRTEADLAAAGEALDPGPWRLLAVAYLELGDEPAAGRVLDDLAARAPGEGAAFREVGRYFLERREPGRSEGYLRRAVAAARGDLSAWRLLAQAHRALRRTPEVMDDLRAILELEPEDPDALHGLGLAALWDEDEAGARAWLGRYQRAAPDRVEAAARVSGEWLEAGHPVEALAAAREALPEAGDDGRLRLAEGTALLRLHRLSEAARELRRVDEDDEAWVPARTALSEALARAGRHAEAARALAGPLERRPGELRLELARAAVLERAGRTREAAAALEQVQSRTRDAEAGEELAVARAGLLCRAGRAAEAVVSLEPAAMARPRSAPLRVALASALVQAGAPGRAAAELRALLVVQPDEAEGLALLARLLADGGGRPEEAEELARRAVELRPHWPPALAALGRALSARGDHAGAVAVLARAVRLSGGQAPFLDDLGDAQLAAGRRREAAAAWRQALAAAADLPPRAAERTRAALRQKLQGAPQDRAAHTLEAASLGPARRASAPAGSPAPAP